MVYIEIMSELKIHDVDIWGNTDTTMDLFFDSTLEVPTPFLGYNFSSFYPAWPTSPTADFDADTLMCKKKRKGKPCPHPYPLPATGPWNLSSIESSFHDGYHPLSEIYSFSQQLAEEYADLVELVKLGRSGEGRDILALNIAKPGRKKHRKMRMVVQGAQHAREVWL